jgi:ankyrin repeat protein
MITNRDIISACADGRLDVLQSFVSRGITIKDLRANDNDAINWACANAHIHVIKYLLSIGLTLEDLRSDDNCALRWACAKGHLVVVKYLISIGLTVEDIRSDYDCAFDWARTYNHDDIVKYITLLDDQYKNLIKVTIHDKIALYTDWQFASHVPVILRNRLTENIIGYVHKYQIDNN